jgi:hypothetical protein
MSSLFNFLIDLATDPKKQELFEQNSSALMAAAGLTETHSTTLKSRNRADITAAFADELETGEFRAVTGSCIIGDPGPDPEPDPDPLPGDGD